MTISNVPNSTVVGPLAPADKLKGMIADLQDKMQKALPGYESALHQIHQALSKDDSTVHLLTDEEVGVIVAGLTKRTGVVIAEQKAAKKSSKKEPITLADL